MTIIDTGGCGFFGHIDRLFSLPLVLIKPDNTQIVMAAIILVILMAFSGCLLSSSILIYEGRKICTWQEHGCNVFPKTGNYAH